MTSTAGVVVIYSGVKSTLGAQHNLHLYMCNHVSLNCIEIFANDPVPGEESYRIYVNAEMVISKLENGVLLEEFDKRMKELLRLNQIHDRSALLRDVTSRLVVKFLLERIKIRIDVDDGPLSTRSCSIFFEPKENDKLSPRGTVDFQYESKPVRVLPARLVMPSGNMMPAVDDIIGDENLIQSPTQMEAEVDNETEGELDSSVLDSELLAIRARNQHEGRHHVHPSDGSQHSLLTSDNDSSWLVGEDHSVSPPPPLLLDNSEKTMSYHEYLVNSSGKSNESTVHYDSDSSEDERTKSQCVEPTEINRKILTRKRSMSESDLFAKAASLAALTVSESSKNGIALDDHAILNSKPTGSNKHMLPHMSSDFHYNRDVPLDGNIPSYLLPTSSNFAKKLPPIRPGSVAGSRPGTATSSRPTTADTSVRRGSNANHTESSFRRSSTTSQGINEVNSIRRNSNSLTDMRRNSSSVSDLNGPRRSSSSVHHGGAVGRIQDLKCHKISPNSVTGIESETSLRKSPLVA